MAVARTSFLDVWREGLERLRRGPLPALTVLAGESAYVKERLIEAAAQCAGGAPEVFGLRPGESVRAAGKRLLDAWTTPSLFGGSGLIVARDADALLKDKGSSQFEERLAGGTPPNRLLLTCEALDGRTRLAKQLKSEGGLVSLPVLRDAPPPWHAGGPFLETDLNQWLVEEARLQGLQLDLPVADALSQRVGNEPGRLAQKLSQLRVLLGDGKRLTLQDVLDHVPISSVRLLHLYEDALVAGQTARAVSLADRMVHEGVLDPFQRLVSGAAVGEAVLRGLVANLARTCEAHERLGPGLLRALTSKPWQRSADDSAALDEILGKGGRRVFLERDLRRVPPAAAGAAFDLALAGLRRLRDGRGLSFLAHTVRLCRAFGGGGAT